MARYDYNLDEERFSGYLSQIQLPGVAKPYLIKDYEARAAVDQVQSEVEDLFKDGETEEEKGEITKLNESIVNINNKIESIETSGGVDFSVNEDVLVITKI